MKTTNLKIWKWLFSFPTAKGYFRWIESSAHQIEPTKYKLHKGQDTTLYLN